MNNIEIFDIPFLTQGVMMYRNLYNKNIARISNLQNTDKLTEMAEVYLISIIIILLFLLYNKRYFQK